MDENQTIQTNKPNKTIIWVVIVLIVIVGGYFLIKGNKPTSTEPIKIGFIGPLTGGAAAYGEPAKNGLEVAILQINDSGGIDGRQIQVIYEDGKCTGKDAVTAAQKLINIDKVHYLIGLPCSGEVLGVAPVSEQNKVILLAQGSSPDITNAGEYIFRIWPSDIFSAKLLAEHATKKGFKKAAIITENTDYAVALEKAFTESFKSLGGNVVDSEKYSSDTTDFKSILTKIKPLAPDMLFINAQVFGSAARITKQARELGIKSQFYSAFLAGDEFVKSGSAVEGTYIVDIPVLNPTNPKATEFLLAYKNIIGGEPAFPFVAAGIYDEMNVLADALKKVGDNTEKIKDYLYSLSSYDGAVGIFSFDKNGDVEGLSLNMRQVKNGGLVDAN